MNHSSTARTPDRRARRGNAPAPRGGDVRALKDFAAVILSVLAFAAVLHYAYLYNIAPSYRYMGLGYREPDILGYTISVVVTAIVALTFPRRIRHASDFILWVLFTVAGAPSILVTQYADILSSDEATVLGVHVAGCLILARVVTVVRPRNFVPRLNLDPTHFWLVLAGVSVGIYGYLAIVYGVHVRMLNVQDVYSVRSEFAEVTGGDALLGYLLPIQFSIINPIFIARGFYGRRPKFLIAGVVGQALIYSTVGYKSVLFSVVALLAVGFLFRRSRILPGARIMQAVTLAAAGAAIADYATSSVTLTALFTRRFLVIPGVLTSAYVLIFTDLPKTNFADSMLPFLHNPYMESPTHIVGRLFIDNADTSANVNIFGHGFLNYGFIGMYVESLVLGLLLWLVDDATRHIPVAVTSFIFLMPATSLANASVFTTVLTHGFAAGLVICAVAPRTGWAERRRLSGPPVYAAGDRARA